MNIYRPNEAKFIGQISMVSSSELVFNVVWVVVFLVAVYDFYLLMLFFFPLISTTI